MGDVHVLVLHKSKSFGDKVRDTIASIGLPLTFTSTCEGLHQQLGHIDCKLLLIEDNPPHVDGLEILRNVRSRTPRLPVILISQNGSIQRAVEAIQSGATDFLPSSCDAEYMITAVTGVNTLSLQERTASSPTAERGTFVTASKTLRQLLSLAEKVADSTATVTIQGESGTGKEMLARFIHLRSTRTNRPFVAMNCAALPETLAESELFGYEKGAFTGADQRKPGRFEQADGGTLLLDEVGELPFALQAKLLRALQEKEIDRVGGRKTIPVDTRVIATTNRDLSTMVKEGGFRQDLYYRLRVIPLYIPPLRERSEDIPLLTEYFIAKHCPKDRYPIPRFSAAAMQHLLNWKWPGNVRELENTVARALLISDGTELGPDNLLIDIDQVDTGSRSEIELVGMTVKDLEKKLIYDTLTHVQQNRTHAARMLGISIRTLRNKLREYRETHEVISSLSGGR